jgi:ankyrin repeat protein
MVAIKLLLKEGANLNIPRYKDQALLLYAMKNGHDATIRELL